MKDSVGDGINYVNASFVANERGIDSDVEIKPENSGYKNKISVKITTDEYAIIIGGTVFGENEQRIVQIGDFKTDFKPKGQMIVFKNTDVPGVIRDISGILAAQNINIADFRLGRSGHGEALAVILVDGDIKANILDELNALKTCIWAKYAQI